MFNLFSMMTIMIFQNNNSNIFICPSTLCKIPKHPTHVTTVDLLETMYQISSFFRAHTSLGGK